MSNESGPSRRGRRVCAGAPVHYEQTVRRGCPGTLCANSQGPAAGGGGCARVRRYTMSKESGTGGPVHYEQTVWAQPRAAVGVHRCAGTL